MSSSSDGPVGRPGSSSSESTTSGTDATTHYAPAPGSGSSGNGLKRPLTLDLTSPKKESPSKKQCLTTPELLSHLVRLSSPDGIKELFAQAAQKATSGLGCLEPAATPLKIYNPQGVTREQEQYARGFIDALNQLYQVRGPPALNGTAQVVPSFLLSPAGLLSPGTVQDTLAAANFALDAKSGKINNNLQHGSSVAKATTSAVSASVPPSSATSAFSVPAKAEGTQQPKSVPAGSGTQQKRASLATVAIATAGSSRSRPSAVIQQTVAPQILIPQVVDDVVSESSLQLPESGPASGRGSSGSPSESTHSSNPDAAHNFFKTQEELKLERKRYRNRLAASRCRHRKLEKISQLESEVKDLTEDNETLKEKLDKAKLDLQSLIELFETHKTMGCNLRVPE